MNRLSIALALSLCALVQTPAHAASGLAPRMRLIETPAQAHPGTVVYLGGSGFPAGQVLPMTTACGDRAISTPHGPKADRNGQFSAFQLRAWTPDARKSILCTVYVRAGKNLPMSTAASASFKVLPAAQPLSRCATHMCLQVQAFLVRLRTGAQGNVSIHGWPGALAQVRVLYPDGTSTHVAVRLHWQGQATVRLVIAPGLKKGLKARIQVNARLGNVVGTDTTQFVVIPGGR